MNRASHVIAIPIDVSREVAEPGIASDVLVLTKARLSLFVIITTFVGFCAASDARLDWLLLANAVLGTTLAAGAAAVLNQFLESITRSIASAWNARSTVRCLPGG